MGKKKRRKYLGRTSFFETAQLVFEISNGLEVDELDYSHINRKRVFFDDVRMVSLHEFFGWRFLLATLALGIVFLILSGAYGRDPYAGSFELYAGRTFAFAALFMFIAFILRLILRVHVVTVSGAHAKAELHFSFRKKLAKKLYSYLCDKTQQAKIDSLRDKLEDEESANAPDPSQI